MVMAESDAKLEKPVRVLPYKGRQVECVLGPLVFLVVGPAEVNLLAPNDVADPLELSGAAEFVHLQELEHVVAVDP